MLKRVLFFVAGLLLASLLGAAVVAGQELRGDDARRVDEKGERLARVLEKLGESVARYQSDLFSITYTETILEERLKRDLRAREGRAKEYVFENVVLREPAKDARDETRVRGVRRLRSEDGKPAEPGKPYVQRRNKCGGGESPSESYGDPLTFLLPKNQPNYEFADEGETAVDGRAARVVRFVPRGQGGPKVVSKGDCFWATVPHEGRVWVEAESGDVLRLEWRIIEPYEFESPRAMNVGRLRFGPKRKLKYERMETVTRFRRVEFKDPAGTLLLPSSSETLRVIGGARRPRTRTTRAFKDYRRFVSDVKIVEEAEPEN